MKITLNASIKEQREIGLVLGAMVCPDNRYFVEWIDGLEYRASRKITIDLDQAQMDLRMALGTGIEFSLKSNPMVYYGRVKGSFIDLHKNIWCDFEEGSLNSNSVFLCPDYLKSVGVEVEE